jgi:hypothetical protein
LTLYDSFKINDSKGEYAIYYDAVYRGGDIIMSKHNNHKRENLIWLLDDEFDSNQIDQIRKMIENRGYELVVSRSDTYKSDYPQMG